MTRLRIAVVVALGLGFALGPPRLGFASPG